MSILRLLHISLFLLFASLIQSLPVAEDRSKLEGSVERSQDAPSIADRSQDPPSDFRISRRGKQLPSFESGQEGSASSLAHAIGVTPPRSEAWTEEKRDDIRKYNSPQPWSYDDYRAVYLAGLARIAREGGGRRDTQRRIPQEIRPSPSESSNPTVEKRESIDKPRPPPPNTDSNASGSGMDRFGLTLQDYERFLRHNLVAGWQHWDADHWENFALRYQEFQASGGQVGIGNRKKRDSPSLEGDQGVSDDEFELMQRDSRELEDIASDNEFPKRDSIDNYEKNMVDEDGRGGREEFEDHAIWEELMRLGNVPKLQRSPENLVDREDPSMPKDGSPEQNSDTVSTPTSAAEAHLFEERHSINQPDENSFAEYPAITSKEYLLFRHISILHRQLLNSRVHGSKGKQYQLPPAGDSSKSIVNDQNLDKPQGIPPELRSRETISQGEPRLLQYQRRDDIRKYKPYLTSIEWERLVQAGAVQPRPRPSNNPTVKRDDVINHQAQSDLESLSPEDFKELYSTAMTDPAFLAFQRQISSNVVGEGSKQKRSPADVHQTAPIHEGPPHAGTNNVAAGNRSLTSDSYSESESSPSPVSAEASGRPLQKRDEVVEKNVDSSTKAPASIKEGAQHRDQPDSTSSHRAPKAATIAEVLAADEAADLADDASIEAKRDSMLLYAGGLDDWDDCVLSKLFSDTDCMDGLERRDRSSKAAKQNRDSMDQYEQSGKKWDSYGELLNAMEEGRLSSFFPARNHPRDLSNFPSWTPSTDPKPPSSDRRDLSNFPSWSPSTDPKPPGSDRRDLSNFPSWGPPDNPHPPKELKEADSREKQKRDADLDSTPKSIESEGKSPYSARSSSHPLANTDQIWIGDSGHLKHQGFSPEKAFTTGGQDELGQERRDRVDQYESNMSDEDEWVDIYRLWTLSRELQQTPNRGKRGQRRTPRPDTVLVRPVRNGVNQAPYYSTIKESNTATPTGLISMIGNVPGPGTARSHLPTTVQAPTSSPPPNPSALFFPFGPLLPLGPDKHAAAADHRRTEDDLAGELARKRMRSSNGRIRSAEGMDESDAWLFREQREIPSKGHVKQKRSSVPPTPSQGSTMPTVTSNVRNISTPAPQMQSKSSDNLPTPPSILSTNISNIVEEFGPLLALASEIPAPQSSASAQHLPSAGSTANISVPARPKRDSITRYGFSHHDDASVQQWDDNDWNVLDNFIAFQDTESPVKDKKRQATPTATTTTTDDNEDTFPVDSLPSSPANATTTTTSPTSRDAPHLITSSAASYTGPLQCLFFNADPTLHVPAGCFCQGDETALPTLAGPSPCAYTALPTSQAAGVSGARAKEKARRDQESKYDSHDEEEENAIWEWVMSGGSRGHGRRGRRDEVQGQGGDQQQQQQEEEEQEGERAQQLEGVQEGLVEEDGIETRGLVGERTDDDMWVPEEEELTEGLPEGASGVGRDGGFKERAVEVGEEKGKRHCGRDETGVLPEGYGDQADVTDLCGESTSSGGG